MKIISAILILVTAALSFKHGWEGLRNNSPGGDPILVSWGLNKTLQLLLSLLTLVTALLILFPQSFFTGNVLSALMFILLICFQLSTGNVKAALIETPFLLFPLVLIYLGHPLKK
ncbi:hypothetical protein CNR22_04225 [Sphingobacteriaceae bacterium]|nr:hypothetical protein CNR22_04225 [Sphingobacteriaceae bacterium]